MNSSEIRQATINGYLSQRKNKNDNSGWSEWIEENGFKPYTDSETKLEYFYKRDVDSSVYIRYYQEYGLWVAEDRSNPEVYSAESLSRTVYDSRGFGIGPSPMSSIEDLDDDQEKMVYALLESSTHVAATLLRRLFNYQRDISVVDNMRDSMKRNLGESLSINFNELYLDGLMR